MKIRIKYIFWIIIPFFFIFVAFSAFKDNSNKEDVTFNENDSIPTRRQLRRSFFQKREILVIYGSKNKELSNRYKILLEKLSSIPRDNSWRSVAVTYKESSQITDSDIKTNIIYLVGTDKGNPILKRLAKNIPFQFQDGKIRYNENELPNDNMILSVGLYPNRVNDSLPISILTGTEEYKIFDFFENGVNEKGLSFFRQNMDFEIYRKNTRIVMGDFGRDWKIDPSTFFDFSTNNKLIYSTSNFDFIDHQKTLNPKTVLSLSSKIEQTTNSILDFFGKTSHLSKMTYHSYKSAEVKGLITGNTKQAHFDSIDNSVHTIINEKYQDNFIEKENALVDVSYTHLTLPTTPYV